MPRPAFLSLDGLDGTGKSTQCRLLVEWLTAQAVPVTACTDPGGTALGQELRQILLFGREHRIATTTEAMLFMASRAQLVQREIRPALARGEVVLLDRFFLSTYAYQVAGHHLSEADVRSANRFATDGLVPDLTLLLRFPAHEGLARAAARPAAHDRMEAMGESFHARVAAALGTFAEPAWQAAHPECGPIVDVDASGPEADVAARVLAVVTHRWPGS